MATSAGANRPPTKTRNAGFTPITGPEDLVSLNSMLQNLFDLVVSLEARLYRVENPKGV